MKKEAKKEICNECKKEKIIYYMNLCLECFAKVQKEDIQRHHIFFKRVRRDLKKRGIKKVFIAWINNEKEKRICIPINSYVIIDEETHKLQHPENIKFNLNWMVVKSGIKLKNEKK